MLSSMDLQPSPEPKRHLSQESFAAFLRWLSPDNGQAAKEYLRLRQALGKYFVRKGCAHAEELTDRTLDRVVLIVHGEPDKYPTPISLCCGVARRVWLEYLREAVPDALEEERVAVANPTYNDLAEREISCLESCLERLPTRERELITRYHQFEGRKKIETRQQLAQTYGGLNKLRITAYRIRVRLHDCVSGCLQRSALN
jgi:DNA-directed RNA polymerase specialized sigma24 family protein